MKLTILLFILSMSSLIASPVFKSVTTNTDSVDIYDKFEITLDITADFKNPFNSSEIDLSCTFTSPSNKTFKVNGFYYQDYTRTGPPETLTANGSPVWKIRFSPVETGIWSYIITCTDKNGTAKSGNKAFTCNFYPSPGFIKPANKNFMKFDDGTQYFAVGENVAWYGSNKTYDYEYWMDNLAMSHVNYIRVWMADWAFAIEWNDTKLGDYTKRLDRAFQLDWVIDYASQKGIYIQLCLNHHGQVSTNVDAEWAYNPYNKANGGPCNGTYDFFTDNTARNYYKQRMRYIIARWGWSANLFSWELFNELDLMDNFSSNKGEEWLDEMSKYIKANDVFGHPVTTSYANYSNDSAVWAMPAIDYTQFHYYGVMTDVQSVHREITENNLAQFKKPVIGGEFGFPGTSYYDKDKTGIDLHNSIWASCFSGSFGVVSTWWWDSYIEPQKIYADYKPLATFMTFVNLLSGTYTPVSAECHSDRATDLNITPAFNAWGIKAPQNSFSVATDGTVSPSEFNLGTFLYGSKWNTQYRNPPKFRVVFNQKGSFTVRTGTDKGTNPTIQIWVDNVKMLDKAADTNKVYTVDLTAGTHEIFVDNQGTDWIIIAEYILNNYAEAVRSYALQSDNLIAGWAQNRNYNWQRVYEKGLPDSITTCNISFTGLKTGWYNAIWYDCKNFNILKSDKIYLSSAKAAFYPPSFLWDVSYRISYIGPTDAVELTSSLSNSIINYPNPFNTSTTIQYKTEKPGNVKIDIHDDKGQFLTTLADEYLPAGNYQLDWKINDKSSSLANGSYLCILSIDNVVAAKNMMVVVR